jgi:hypothetical protein
MLASGNRGGLNSAYADTQDWRGANHLVLDIVVWKRQTREGHCSVEGCEQPIKARGLCDAHYSAARRHGGDPLGRHIVSKCSVDGCEEPAHGKGMCARHYKLMKRHGDPHYQRPPATTCGADDCNQPAVTKGYCNAHYQRFKRYGDPLGRPQRRKAIQDQRQDMLTAEQIRLIQSRRGTAPNKTASEFGTTVRTVIAIQAGRNWGWLAK